MKFWVAEKYKLCKIYCKLSEMYGEAYFCPIAYLPELKRKSTELKYTDYPLKKEFRAQQSINKVIVTVFWTNDYLFSLIKVKLKTVQPNINFLGNISPQFTYIYIYIYYNVQMLRKMIVDGWQIWRTWCIGKRLIL